MIYYNMLGIGLGWPICISLVLTRSRLIPQKVCSSVPNISSPLILYQVPDYGKSAVVWHRNQHLLCWLGGLWGTYDWLDWKWLTNNAIRLINIIHTFETYISVFDPEPAQSCGVWYCIVRIMYRLNNTLYYVAVI